MAHKTTFPLLMSLLLHEIVMVNSETYDKKTLDGMILKTLWTKVYTGFDPKVKEQAIATLRKTGDYDKLIHQLLKVKKEKVQKILNLLAEIIIAYRKFYNCIRVVLGASLRAEVLTIPFESDPLTYISWIYSDTILRYIENMYKKLPAGR